MCWLGVRDVGSCAAVFMLLYRLRIFDNLGTIDGIESVACHRITCDLIISNSHSEGIVKAALKVM